jgi:hypothetical protein
VLRHQHPAPRPCRGIRVHLTSPRVASQCPACRALVVPVSRSRPRRVALPYVDGSLRPRP